MSSYKRMNINMNGIHVSISEDVYLLKDVTIENRRYFHKYPEASLKEYSTAEYIRNFLDENSIEYIKVGETGTLAIIKGEKVSDLNKTIFLRGDIDATEIDDRKTVSYASKNPGVCHASGHDAQAAALLSAAVVLNSRRNQFSGTVKIAFQQAEEIGEGAVKFLSEGLLDDVNFAFALHIASYLPVGKIGVTPGPQSASCDIFKIKINGEGAHVSTPEKGRDALLATANTVMQLQNITSNQVSPLKDALLSIGRIEAGSNFNVIASSGTIEGSLRTFDEQTRLRILNKIENIAKHASGISDCSIEFENHNAAKSIVNDPVKTEFSQIAISNIVGEENIITNMDKTFSAEDFANYLTDIPGTFVKVGSQNPDDERTHYPHHNPLFDIDENALLVAAQTYVETAFMYLNHV